MTIEDLTTYTEVDPNSHLSATTTRASGSNVRRNETCYQYYDKGVDFFNELDIDFTIRLSTSGSGPALGVFGLANNLNDFNALAATDIFVLFYAPSDNRLYINKGELAGSDYTSASPNTTYYCTLRRSAGADSVYLDVYTNSARTTLKDTLEITGLSGVKWRYIYALASYNTGATTACSGYVENIDIPDIALSSLSFRRRSFNSILVR